MAICGIKGCGMKIHIVHGGPTRIITEGDDGIIEKVEPPYMLQSALGRKASDVLNEFPVGTMVDTLSFNKDS